jgi:hypothetical protein
VLTYEVEARVKPTAGFQARTLEANIRDFLGELDYLNADEAVEGWDDITCLQRSLESLIVAEICECSLVENAVTDD